jgi:hypothetical protein
MDSEYDHDLDDPPLRDHPNSARNWLYDEIPGWEPALAGLFSGEAPSAIGQQLLACPTFVRLDRVLRCYDGVSAGELQHVAICPDCVVRVRTLRRLHEVETRAHFESLLQSGVGGLRARSPFAEAAENDARLCFALIGQDANLDIWQQAAWKCSHTIARGLHKARENGATAEDLVVLLELRLTALGAAASDPTVVCARMFDGAWPLVEMIKEAAVEVAAIGSSLFRPFARCVGSASRLAGGRMRAMLAYASVELIDHGEDARELAVLMIHELTSPQNGPIPLFLAALIHRNATLPAALRSSCAAGLVNARRLHEVIRTRARSRYAIERVLSDPEMTTSQAIEQILPAIRRSVDDLLAAPDPEEALLRLVAFRQLLRRIGRVSPDNCVSMSDVFRAIGELLVTRANSSRASGSTFLLIKIVEVVRDQFPAAFASLADLLPTMAGIVRHGMIACAAESYESGRNPPPAASPKFTLVGESWSFDGPPTAKANAFCRNAARVASRNPELKKHLRWMNDRLAISLRRFEASSTTRA